MNLLLVGNSYSFDLCRYIVPMLESSGVHDFLIADAYRGDSSFSVQYELGKSGENGFGYNHMSGREMVCDFDDLKSLEYIVKSGTWDVVTFQQRSFCAGHEKYEDFDRLRDLVFGWCENRPKTGLIIPWAYAVNCTHDEFKRFGSDQTDMYGKITADAEEFLAARGKEIDFVIPVGQIIQKARGLYPDPCDYSRDGVHLNGNGMFDGTCAVLKYLFGVDPKDVAYMPEGMTVPAEKHKSIV